MVRRCVLAVCALLLARAAGAQTPPRAGTPPPLIHLSLEELGNVEVTSVSKGPETLLQSPTAIFVITQEDIRRSGATSLPEVLRLAPGIEIGRIDSGHWSVGVRGFGDGFSKSLLVLIDGRSVYTPLFAGIYWAVEDTLLEDIDRVEVIRGPGGTIWGANAVNGVINIITKNSDETAGLLVSTGAGSIDQGIGGFRFGGKYGSKLTYRVYGKSFSRGPQFHTDGHEYDDWRMGQSGFRTDWKNGANAITIQGDIYKSRVGQNVVYGNLTPPSDIMSYDPVRLSGGNLLTRWSRKAANGSDFQLQAFYDRTYLMGPQIGETRNTFDADFVHHMPNLKRHDVRWGLGVRISPSTVTQTVGGLDVLPHDETGSAYSAFAEDEVSLVRNHLWLTVGSKIEHNNYTGAETQPSVRVLWKPDERQALWASATKSVRTPSRIEEGIQLLRLLSPTPPTFLRLVGNPDFQSERLRGIEGGYRRALADRLFVDVAVFHNRHDRLQSLGAGVAQVDPGPPMRVFFVVPYRNTIRGSSNGVEIAPDWKPARWLQLKGSYAYLDIELENTLVTTDIFNLVPLYEGSSPRHRITLRPMVSLSKGWEIDPMYRHVSGLPGRRIPSYHTLDMRIGRRIRSNLEVSAIGQNLLQGHHLEFGHDPGPAVAIKRAVFASVVWRR